MRSLSILKRSLTILALAAVVPTAACDKEEDAGPPTLAIAETSYLPPVYSPQQCASLVSSFPGWANVAPVPEYDGQGRPTLFYAAIPITRRQQLADLKTVGIHTDSLPIFMDPAVQAQYDGKIGVVSKSTCGGGQMVWALVPGPIFNVIAKQTVALGETLVESIILLPVPDADADTSVTYQGLHSVSYQVLHDAHFRYLADAAPPPDSGSSDTEVQQGALLGEIVSAAKGFAKGVVGVGADAWNGIKGGVETGLGWLDRKFEGSVKLTVQLDVRNIDSSFGPPTDDVHTDKSTPMQRAWGAHPGDQIQLPGVTVSARQTLGGVTTRFDGMTGATSAASLDVTKGKSTAFCIETENFAASIHDMLNAMDLCDFQHALIDRNGVAEGRTSFDTDSVVNLRLQNKYINMLAQFTNGNRYLRDVVGYTPHQVSVLTGSPANLLPLDGRAVTPCLDFPDVAFDGVNVLLESASAALAGPLGWLFAGTVEAIYEVDMWMPDGASYAADRTLEDRTVSSHEYGHFAMCSMLYDEDPSKMVQIPSLLIQRIAEGKYMNVADETTRIMEAWADFFAGQTASGYNYFHFPNDDQRSAVKYCYGVDKPCWEGNYVEDNATTTDPYHSNEDSGTPNQMRKVATILFDAFDGHPRGIDAPGRADYWAADLHETTPAGLARLVPAAANPSPADDDPIALPGAGLRKLIHNWTHAASPLGWRVNEQQFFGALNATVRSTPRDPSTTASKYSWCDACALFAPHDGRSCTAVGATAQEGLCSDSAGNPIDQKPTMSQMVAICVQDPIHGFIGDKPPVTDATSACTFTGCPARTILVGSPGDATAACVACGPHQISVGTQTCANCASTNVGAASCQECGANEVVGGADGNTCVACPLHAVPNAAKAACVSCQYREVAVGGSCRACPAGTWAAPDETCQACPAGQVPYENTCLPISECTCNADRCARMDPSGLLCVDIVG